MNRKIVVLVWLILSSQVSAQAPPQGGSEPLYDVYQLSAEAQIDVANDLMTVNLVATATGSDAAQLANKINATMGWAVNKLGPFTAIETKTLDYQTHPQYERNGSRIKGWVASQSIQLETDDFERDFGNFRENGIEFEEPPRSEPYGTVAVFRDAFGNRWDLIEPA